MSPSHAERLERDMTASNTTARLFFGGRQPSWLTGQATPTPSKRPKSPETHTRRAPPPPPRASSTSRETHISSIQKSSNAALPSPALSHDIPPNTSNVTNRTSPNLPTPSTTPCPPPSRDTPTAFTVATAATAATPLISTPAAVSALEQTPKSAAPKSSTPTVTASVATLRVEQSETSPVSASVEPVSTVPDPSTPAARVPFVSTAAETHPVSAVVAALSRSNSGVVTPKPVNGATQDSPLVSSAASNATSTPRPARLTSPRSGGVSSMLTRLNQYILDARGNLKPGTTARLHLLQEAIGSGKNTDLHALLLHQVICLVDQPSGPPVMLVKAVSNFSVGQAAVQEIMTPNKEVDGSFLEWFTSGPFDLLNRHSATDPVYLAAVNCLKQLSSNFLRIMRLVWSEQRCFTFEEIAEDLGLSSPVLRRALLKRYLNTQHPHMTHREREDIWNIIASNEVEYTSRRKSPASHRSAQAAHKDYASRMAAVMQRSASRAATPQINQAHTQAQAQAQRQDILGPPLHISNATAPGAAPKQLPRAGQPPYMMPGHGQNGQDAHHWSAQKHPSAPGSPAIAHQWQSASSESIHYPGYNFAGYGPNASPQARGFPPPQRRVTTPATNFNPRIAIPPNRAASLQMAANWQNLRQSNDPAYVCSSPVSPVGPAPYASPQQLNLPIGNMGQGHQIQSLNHHARPPNPAGETRFFIDRNARGEQVVPPQPNIYALHQSHLDSPRLSSRSLSSRLFRFVEAFALTPQQFQEKFMSLSWSFEVSGALAKRLARSTQESETSDPVRHVDANTSFLRLRVVKKSASSSMSEWVTSDTEWPIHTYYSCNDHHLQPRLKQHNGHDLAVDLTEMIKAGVNTIKVLSNARPDQPLDKYALAVEIVSVGDEASILQTCKSKQVLSAAKSKEKLAKILTQADDDDIVCTNESVSIPMSDPISGMLCKIPVKGQDCLHHHCFDLETFLISRPPMKADPAPPSAVDVWKCPICGADARPQSLMIDGWMLAVRNELEQLGQLDTKFIEVNEKCEWTPRSANISSTAPSITTNLKCITDSKDGMNGDLAFKSNPATTPQTTNASARPPPEIIELDDD